MPIDSCYSKYRLSPKKFLKKGHFGTFNSRETLTSCFASLGFTKSYKNTECANKKTDSLQKMKNLNVDEETERDDRQPANTIA